MEVFISGQIPSSKNSKIATSKGVFHSKTVMKWLRSIGIQSYSVSKKQVVKYKTKECLFPEKELLEAFSNIEYPVEVGLHFVRNSKIKFDFHNASQIVLDLLVAFDIVPDDDMNHIIPYAHKINDSYYSIDKNNPGVIVVVNRNK